MRHKSKNSGTGKRGGSQAVQRRTPRPSALLFVFSFRSFGCVACACLAARSAATCIKTSTRHDLNRDTIGVHKGYFEDTF